MTTRFPVMCAVSSFRPRKPITSTMPAIAVRKSGRRLCNSSTSELWLGCSSKRYSALAAADILIPPFAHRVCTIRPTSQVIGDDLGNDDTEGHGENDDECRHP